MSEERFEAIEQTLDAHTKTLGAHTETLDAHTKTLDAHTKTLDAHTKTLDAHTAKLDVHTSILNDHTATLAALKTGQEEIHLHLIRIDGRLDKNDGRLDRIEITLEGMRGDIKQISEGHAATQALITRNFVAMHALIEAKVDPFLRVVQEHSAVLAAHNLSLPWDKP